jgi:NAD dependent epimerase/dehydratase family enzyme
LGKVLRRPSIFPLPEFAVRLAFGEMGQELLLASQRVHPGIALAAGFQYRHARLPQALEHLLR